MKVPFDFMFLIGEGMFQEHSECSRMMMQCVSLCADAEFLLVIVSVIPYTPNIASSFVPTVQAMGTSFTFP